MDEYEYHKYIRDENNKTRLAYYQAVWFSFSVNGSKDMPKLDAFLFKDEIKTEPVKEQTLEDIKETMQMIAIRSQLAAKKGR